MLLRVFKGFRYNLTPLGFRFSTESSFKVKNLLASLSAIPNHSTNIDCQAKAIPILQQIKPNLHEFSQEDILNLAIYTSNHHLLDKDLSDFFTKNFKAMLVSRSFSLKEMSLYLNLIKRDWTPEESTLITNYIDFFKAEITPNIVSLLLSGTGGFTFSNKTISHLLEEKAIEFIPYLNIDQLQYVVYGMLARFNNSNDFWQKVENKILANFLFLHPKEINSFCIAFLEGGKGSETFWKTCKESVEASAAKYENIRFFFPYLGKSKSGSSELWNKYEKNLLAKLPTMDNFELLQNFKVLTEAEKGSHECYLAMNKSLTERMEKFDLHTNYLYALTLVPFSKMIISQENWTKIVDRVVNEFNSLDQGSQMTLSSVMEEVEEKLKRKQKEESQENNEDDDEEVAEEKSERIKEKSTKSDTKQDFKSPRPFIKKERGQMMEKKQGEEKNQESKDQKDRKQGFEKKTEEVKQSKENKGKENKNQGWKKGTQGKKKQGFISEEK